MPKNYDLIRDLIIGESADSGECMHFAVAQNQCFSACSKLVKKKPFSQFSEGPFHTVEFKGFVKSQPVSHN